MDGFLISREKSFGKRRSIGGFGFCCVSEGATDCSVAMTHPIPCSRLASIDGHMECSRVLLPGVLNLPSLSSVSLEDRWRYLIARVAAT